MKPSRILATALLLLMSLPLQASLLVNGGFEDGLTGWELTLLPNGSIEVDGGAGTTEGELAALFNTADRVGGLLQQSFSTVVGETYQLGFDYGVFSVSFPGRQQELFVGVGGNQELLNTNVTGSASSPTNFQSFLFEFTADSLTTTLAFGDLTDLAGSFSVDGVLDNVFVLPTSGNNATVAAPAAAYLLLPGLWLLMRRSGKRWKTS